MEYQKHDVPTKGINARMTNIFTKLMAKKMEMQSQESYKTIGNILPTPIIIMII